MSDLCSHCHKLVHRACSSYAGSARVQQLQSCTNLSEVDRHLAAACCEGAENRDRDLAVYVALKALCGPHAAVG